MIAVVIIAFSYIRGSNASFYLLVINYNSESQSSVTEVVNDIAHKKLKTKTITDGITEATYEIRLKDENTWFVSELSSIDGVKVQRLSVMMGILISHLHKYGWISNCISHNQLIRMQDIL